MHNSLGYRTAGRKNLISSKSEREDIRVQYRPHAKRVRPKWADFFLTYVNSPTALAVGLREDNALSFKRFFFPIIAKTMTGKKSNEN